MSIGCDAGWTTTVPGDPSSFMRGERGRVYVAGYVEVGIQVA